MGLLSTSPHPVFIWSRYALVLGYGLGLAMVLGLAFVFPKGLFLLPLILMAGLGAWQLFKHPTLNLLLLLGGFVMVSNTQEGLQASEALYGAYYFGYVGHWLLMRWLRQESFIETKFDLLYALFIGWILLSVFQTVLFNGDFKGYFSEMIALAFFFLYFPVKELCAKHPKGAQLLIGIFAFQGLYAALRNLINYRQIIINAQFAWQLEKGRVITNEQLLLIPALICLILFLYERRTVWKTGFLGGFLLFLGSLILTQSRAYWVDFAFGAFALFWFLDWKRKTQLVSISSLALAVFVFLGIVFFGDLFYTVLQGLLKRFVSLGSATTSDISLVNRFLETSAAWAKVVQNPILGYGTGVSYSVYDMTFRFTQVDTFVHNGFVGFWYKFGIIGLGIIVFIWLKSIWNLLVTWIQTPLQVRYSFNALAGLMLAIALISLLPSATTSNPFYLKDAIMTFALLFGGAAGMTQKLKYK